MTDWRLEVYLKKLNDRLMTCHNMTCGGATCIWRTTDGRHAQTPCLARLRRN